MIRWWSRRRQRGPSPATVEARRRLEKAQQSLEAARADDDVVEELAARVDELRRRNHFGPMISQALRGSR